MKAYPSNDGIYSYGMKSSRLLSPTGEIPARLTRLYFDRRGAEAYLISLRRRVEILRFIIMRLETKINRKMILDT
jgi:hypothetical protein